MAMLTFQQSTNAQCYVHLDNISAHEYLVDERAELEAAACNLRDSLPFIYRDSFQVFDFGFYALNAHMEGGEEAVWQRVIQEVESQSKYYLVIGRKGDGGVRNALKIPEWIFDCYNLDYISYLEAQISRLINEDNTSNGIMSAMAYASREIAKAYQCCSSNFKNSCSTCPNNIDEFRTFLESNGFISAPIKHLSYSEQEQQNGVVKSYHDISCTLNDGTQLNINQDVETYLNTISSKVEGIQGNIAHYDPLSPYCEKVIEIITGILPVALQGNPNSNTKNNKSLTQDRYFLKMDVITTEDRWGNAEVHVRSSEDLGNLPSTNTGTIYLVNIDDPSIDDSKIVSNCIRYWELLLVNSLDPSLPQVVSRIPKVVSTNSVNVFDLHSLDAVSIYGVNESTIVKYVQDYFFQYDNDYLEGWILKINSIERGQADNFGRNIGRTSVVSTKRVGTMWKQIIDRNIEWNIDYIIKLNRKPPLFRGQINIRELVKNRFLK